MQLEMVEAAQPAAVAQLKKLVLELPALLVREQHYSLAQTAMEALEQVLQEHCLLSDVALYLVQEQVPVQQDHLLLA